MEKNIKRKFMVKETHEIIEGIDNEGNRILNQYTVLSELGSGAFSKVKLVYDVTNNIYYAAKIIKKKELSLKKKNLKKDKSGKLIIDSYLKDAMRELAILKKIECPNIIQLREIIHEDIADKIWLILDFAERGTILDFDKDQNKYSINKYYLLDEDREEIYTEEEIKDFLRGIVIGLDYRKIYLNLVHSHKIVHRDIKPDNILLDKNNNPKITDFNVSAMMDRYKENKIDSVEGTMYFYAPETCTDKNDSNFDAFPLDIWALGVTTFCLTFLELPFHSPNNNFEKLLDQIKNSEIVFPEIRKISDDLSNLMRSMLIKDPDKRITIQGLINNKWLNEAREHLTLKVKK